MQLCLVVQQDTLEGETLGAVLAVTTTTPQEFVTELQSHHCIPYQLIAYTNHSVELEQACRAAAAPYKADLGKDWYRFNHQALSELITLFLEDGISVVDVRCVAQIYGFTLQIVPVVNREVTVRPVGHGRPSSTRPVTGAEIEHPAATHTVSPIETHMVSPTETHSNADRSSHRSRKERSPSAKGEDRGGNKRGERGEDRGGNKRGEKREERGGEKREERGGERGSEKRDDKAIANEVVETKDEIVTIIEDLNKTKSRDNKDGKGDRRKH